MSRIREDVTIPPCWTEIARSVNLSASRLQHLFKAHINMTPAQYLKSLRISQAKELLETTPLSVKEIRARLGITDESHFVRDFKKAYGVSPLKYRVQFHAQRHDSYFGQ